MKEMLRNKSIYQYLLLISVVLLLIYSHYLFDEGFINNFIQDSHVKFANAGILTALLIFFLRFISIVIPILPGTYCSILAGYFYGIETGLSLIFAADFISCATSFLISRKLGRGVVRTILGSNQMKRVESISQKYLEKNFFLMTGLLMTQFFDFVCYAIGLTKVKWSKFFPALIISIIISDAPFVSGGSALKNIGIVSLSELLNGDVQVLKGPELTIFICSVVAIFSLGVLSNFLNKDANFHQKDEP